MKNVSLTDEQMKFFQQLLDGYLKATGAQNIGMVFSLFQSLAAAQTPKVETPNAND